MMKNDNNKNDDKSLLIRRLDSIIESLSSATTTATTTATTATTKAIKNANLLLLSQIKILLEFSKNEDNLVYFNNEMIVDLDLFRCMVKVLSNEEKETKSMGFSLLLVLMETRSESRTIDNRYNEEVFDLSIQMIKQEPLRSELKEKLFVFLKHVILLLKKPIMKIIKSALLIGEEAMKEEEINSNVYFNAVEMLTLLAIDNFEKCKKEDASMERIIALLLQQTNQETKTKENIILILKHYSLSSVVLRRKSIDWCMNIVITERIGTWIRSSALQIINNYLPYYQGDKKKVVYLCLDVIKEETITSDVKKEAFLVLRSLSDFCSPREIMMEQLYPLMFKIMKEEPFGSKVTETIFFFLLKAWDEKKTTWTIQLIEETKQAIGKNHLDSQARMYAFKLLTCLATNGRDYFLQIKEMMKEVKGILVEDKQQSLESWKSVFYFYCCLHNYEDYEEIEFLLLLYENFHHSEKKQEEILSTLRIWPHNEKVFEKMFPFILYTLPRDERKKDALRFLCSFSCYLENVSMIMNELNWIKKNGKKTTFIWMIFSNLAKKGMDGNQLIDAMEEEMKDGNILNDEFVIFLFSLKNANASAFRLLFVFDFINTNFGSFKIDMERKYEMFTYLLSDVRNQTKIFSSGHLDDRARHYGKKRESYGYSFIQSLAFIEKQQKIKLFLLIRKVPMEIVKVIGEYSLYMDEATRFLE